MDIHAALINLREVLARLYSKEADIRRIASDGGLNIENISFSGQAMNDWFAVLREAGNTEKLFSLMAIVFREYGTNSRLFEAYDTFRIYDVKKSKLDQMFFQDIDDAGIGIKNALKYEIDKLSEIERQLARFAKDKSQVMLKPICFGSNPASIHAYVEGLGLVKEKFWTTTYLLSGFWAQEKDLSIERANRDMLNRLSGRKGSVRRLFLLNEPLSVFINSWQQELAGHRKKGNEDEIKRIINRLKIVRARMDILTKEGTSIKVVFDDPHIDLIPPGLIEQFEYGDSEIAIYDDRRIDIFGGGKAGKIEKISIFTEATSNFSPILQRMEIYFDTLWNQEAKSIDEYFERLFAAHEFIDSRIEYEKNWLSKFEFYLLPEDIDMKDAEMDRVVKLLHQLNMWGNIHRYLDIGTCTARYPIGLLEAVEEDGEIIGIDNDSDCIKFSQSMWDLKVNADPRISIRQIDAREIPDIGQFDLITCMLGTISHLGWNKKEDFDDDLQNVLKNMAELLTLDGVLIISNWSQSAVRRKRLLNIYDDPACKKLVEWTPTKLELEKRLNAVGLRVVEEFHPVDRLDLLVCKVDQRA